MEAIEKFELSRKVFKEDLQNELKEFDILVQKQETFVEAENKCEFLNYIISELETINNSLQ